mgnify:CR=1 FL=1
MCIRDSFDAIQDGIMVASPDLTILRVNKAVEKRFPHIQGLSLIHISEPTRLLSISYAVFCLKKKTLQH